MPVFSRIFGWSPPDNRDYVEVAVSPDELQPLENPAFHISDTNPIKYIRHTTSGHHASSSPGSSTSALSTDGDPPPCHKPTGKRNDPNWVARPRNEFILFRCDYVRKHSREGKRARKAPGADPEKTLSKQAAEAWHHLSPEERLYWKERANGERNEHARRYPDYRYRPKKGAGGRRRPPKSSNTKTCGSMDKSTDEGNGMLEPNNPTASETHSPSLSGVTPRKPVPRRYSSVPEFTVSNPVNRRLRSTASHSWLATPVASPAQGTGFALTPSLHPYAPLPLRLQSTAPFMAKDYSQSPKPQPPAPIIHSTSSSLLNWNGERMVASPPQPTQYVSSTSVSLFSGVDIANGPTLAEFTSGGNPIESAQCLDMNAGPFQPNGDIWMPLSTYSSDDRSTSTTLTNPSSESFEASSIQAQSDSSLPQTPSSMAIYEEPEEDRMIDLVDYAMNSTNCGSIDMLGGGSASHESLFAIEAEDLFAPIY
ncbi:hypothetical protein CVT26_010788 [Gymnopilus dilepis]|uniref:HMG box domain-containing protein n=1 Tax=Gymnopilus dilepis TaxID=231916 RepID=A0A409VID5_9AGAR|nr:hypothetical protein CVT26_010788 [Gymnopilus dilepis]